MVAGASIVHTGAAEYLVQMIKGGYVNVLISGNALAVYDIESALFGTALGLNLEGGTLSETGHKNYIRAINTARAAGGIGSLVSAGTLTSGIMHACVKHKVDVLLTGSIRDDGPLPEVVTDSMEGQRLIREKIQDVSFAVLMGTMFHSVAVANLLPGNVKTLAVDINPAVVAKLTDQQTFGALGLVTDIEPFMRELTGCLKALRRDANMSP
jgi:lysine-ketoglutarate reductase/saccharopine dehydrogenase-like protein (TIGR00300 family)